MRSNDPRRSYETPVERPTDYHDLHMCAKCGTVHQLATASREGWWWVVTRCRCAVYSTEAGPYTELRAVHERKRMLAGLPPSVVEPDGQNARNVYWDHRRCHWHVQVKVDGRKLSRRVPTHAQALRVRDELEARRAPARAAA